jgi:hypothetical protein
MDAAAEVVVRDAPGAVADEYLYGHDAYSAGNACNVGDAFETELAAEVPELPTLIKPF